LGPLPPANKRLSLQERTVAERREDDADFFFFGVVVVFAACESTGFFGGDTQHQRDNRRVGFGLGIKGGW